MSAPPSKPSQPPATTFNERLNEQLVNCLNVQTSVIQNLAQYSQHISIQLFEIKNIVEILSNRVLTLQQQQQQQSHFAPSHYAASYYPNYMPQHPQQIPVSHPPPSSHPPSIPLSVQQQPVHMRVPTTSTAPTNPTLPFFPSNVTNPQQHPQQHQQHQPQPPPQSSSSFQFSTSAGGPPPQTTISNTLPPTTTTPTKSIFSNPPKFGIADMIAKPAASLFPTNPTNEKPAANSPFTFGTSNTTPSFGTNTTPSIFGTNPAPSIFGTGGLVSGLPTNSTIKQDTNADENGEDEVDDESYEPNVSFKPIVTLSAVEVKTGEEDENVLFCERAKLYRFDSATNQMKERGTGEIKILQHKTTNVCRILMRREQVLKLCANHQITSQMELKPHQGSENAYVWSAMDYAEGEAKHETLCVRFKSSDTAKRFVKQFDEAKQTNANAQQ